jgi:hypothetical protein
VELYSPYAKSSACNNSNPATKIVDSLLRPDDGVKSGLHSEGYLGMGSIVCWGYSRKTLSDDVTASIRITVVVKTAWENVISPDIRMTHVDSSMKICLCFVMVYVTSIS